MGDVKTNNSHKFNCLNSPSGCTSEALTPLSLVRWRYIISAIVTRVKFSVISRAILTKLVSVFGRLSHR